MSFVERRMKSIRYPADPRRKRISPKLRRLIYDRDNGTCGYCGTPVPFDSKSMQIDHMLPVYHGGTNDPDNLITACQPCNWWKSSLTVDEFRAIVGFRRRGVPWFSKAQREWIKANIFDMEGFWDQVEDHTFWFEMKGEH